MKYSNNGLVVHYEASDYEPHKSFPEIIEGMEASNKRRMEANNKAVIYVAQCLICPDQPKFENIEAANHHDHLFINQHRVIMGSGPILGD
jgi:hypothetical protein